MTESASPQPSTFSTIKNRLTEPRILSSIALALVLGVTAALLASNIYLKPIRASADNRFQSHLCLMRLLDLQEAYHKQHGTYANDLDTLLAGVPDASQLREKLKASVDINTLAVVGDAERFRLEANILDEKRTSVKIRGPRGKR